jgi:hypothetical protein
MQHIVQLDSTACMDIQCLGPPSAMLRYMQQCSLLLPGVQDPYNQCLLHVRCNCRQDVVDCMGRKYGIVAVVD